MKENARSLSFSLGREAQTFGFQGQGEEGRVTFVCFRGCHKVWSILGVDLVFPQGLGVVGERLECGTVGEGYLEGDGSLSMLHWGWR